MLKNSSTMLEKTVLDIKNLAADPFSGLKGAMDKTIEILDPKSPKVNTVFVLLRRYKRLKLASIHRTETKNHYNIEENTLFSDFMDLLDLIEEYDLK